MFLYPISFAVWILRTSIDGMHSDLSSKTGNDAISMGNFILQHRITKVRGYIYEGITGYISTPKGKGPRVFNLFYNVVIGTLTRHDNIVGNPMKDCIKPYLGY